MRPRPPLAPALVALITALIAASLSGCSTAGYYWQLARGQIELLRARQPIAAVVADPQQDPALRERLGELERARTFAARTLRLPDNRSYTLYADVGRDFVVWNVFATPEFSLHPVESCFPIAGCLSYRGYFAQADAERQAQRLREQGYETFIGGVRAYSTLGWFDDPVINTMMRWSDAQLIRTLFHELAHQRLYVRDDTAFNESFASFVGAQGLSDYLALHEVAGLDEAAEATREQRHHDFVALILDTRRALEAVYAQPLASDAMRQARQAVLDDLAARYRVLRDERWGGYAGYDAWFDEPVTNARLLPYGLYDQWVPAFAALWREHDRDWAEFYEAARALGDRPAAERLRRLQQLAGADGA